MQWSAESNADFTAGEPWIEVNPNFSAINVENDKNNDKSIYQFYKKLIDLRKVNDLIVYGDYKLLDSEPEIFAYTRTYENKEWRVVCNFSDREVESALLCDGEIVIHNYDSPAEKLRPYEAVVFKLKN